MKKPSRNSVLAASLFSVVFAMTGLAFASVPLYRLFCQITGFQGTTQRAESESDRRLERQVVVRFDANISGGLPWSFEPEVPQVVVDLGETAIVNFVAENTGNETTVGTAIFNVEPDITGAYFNKIECFCFTEQALKPGERIEMPVQFFVSPDMASDRNLDPIRTITLSYTFYPAIPARQPVAQASGDESGKSL